MCSLHIIAEERFWELAEWLRAGPVGRMGGLRRVLAFQGGAILRAAAGYLYRKIRDDMNNGHVGEREDAG